MRRKGKENKEMNIEREVIERWLKQKQKGKTDRQRKIDRGERVRQVAQERKREERQRGGKN